MTSAIRTTSCDVFPDQPDPAWLTDAHPFHPTASGSLRIATALAQAPARLDTGPGTGGIRLVHTLAGPSADPRQLLPHRQIHHARGAEPDAATTIRGKPRWRC